VILAGEPSHEWFHRHVAAWTGDIHVSNVVTDLSAYIPVLAFGTGLVFGFSFETSGRGQRASALLEPEAADERVSSEEAEGTPSPEEEPAENASSEGTRETVRN
jgi:hypothetical protein